MESTRPHVPVQGNYITHTLTHTHTINDQLTNISFSSVCCHLHRLQKPEEGGTRVLNPVTKATKPRWASVTLHWSLPDPANTHSMILWALDRACTFLALFPLLYFGEVRSLQFMLLLDHESNICSSDPVLCIKIPKYAWIVRRCAPWVTLLVSFNVLFLAAHFCFYMEIKYFTSLAHDCDCESEITQMCPIHMWMSGFVGNKAFNGFGDFVWNRYGSFSIRLNHIISNGDGATTCWQSPRHFGVWLIALFGFACCQSAKKCLENRAAVRTSFGAEQLRLITYKLVFSIY